MKTGDPFDAFWAAYPRRRPNPKAAAKAQWQRELKRAGVNAAGIVAAAVRFAEACRADGIDQKYVPYAMRWLARQQYADYAAVGEADRPASDAVEAPVAEVSTSPAERLKAAIGEAAYRSWIEPCTLTVEGECLTVRAPTSFTVKFIRGKFLDQCCIAYGATMIDFTVDGEQP